MSNRCEFCNTPVQVKGDTTKHYESDYDRVCAELEKERAMVETLAEGLEYMANPLRCLDIVYKPWPEVMNKLAEDLLAKLKAQREG